MSIWQCEKTDMENKEENILQPTEDEYYSVKRETERHLICLHSKSDWFMYFWDCILLFFVVVCFNRTDEAVEYLKMSKVCFMIS